MGRDVVEEFSCSRLKRTRTINSLSRKKKEIFFSQVLDLCKNEFDTGFGSSGALPPPNENTLTSPPQY
jgi:hypothetical protein